VVGALTLAGGGAEGLAADAGTVSAHGVAEGCLPTKIPLVPRVSAAYTPRVALSCLGGGGGLRLFKTCELGKKGAVAAG